VTLPGSDVRSYVPPAEVRGILAAPPCTEFSISGARWWASKPPGLLEEALSVFDACLGIIKTTKATWWALENPVGRLKRLRPELGEPALVFDPCDFGDSWTKRTQIWGTFRLPTPLCLKVRTEAKNRIHWMPPGPERAKKRSMTPPGFARAFFEANP
jgi:hypothetical protein